MCADMLAIKNLQEQFHHQSSMVNHNNKYGLICIIDCNSGGGSTIESWSGKLNIKFCDYINHDGVYLL